MMESTEDQYEEEAEESIQNSAHTLRTRLEDLLEGFSSFSDTNNTNSSLTSSMMEEQFLILISQFSDESLKRAVRMTTNVSESSPRYTNRLPLNLACDKNAPLQVIQYLLDSDDDKSSVLHKDKWGDLPIHTACSRQNYAEVVQLLLDYDETKQTLLEKDIHGYLPIHMACRYQAPLKVIQTLLESDTSNTSLYQEEMYGQLPLHVACRCNASPSTLQLLIDYDVRKTSLSKVDSAGRIPIHVAFLRIRDSDSLRLLLKAMIVGRMERQGLDIWKRDILYFMEQMAIYERDFNTRDKLDIVIKVLQTMMDQVHVLELVLWKFACLRFYNEEEVSQLNSTIRQSCRIKSGAEEIIKNVLPFVEDEPIDEILKQF